MQLLGFYILSKNIPAIVKFYVELLSAEAIGESNHFSINPPDGKGQFTLWDDGNVPNTVNEKMHLWFSVENVDNEYNRLLKMNVKVIEPPVNNPWGARHMVFCDPDGNRIRFITSAK